jgi:hypothetical protein
MLARRVARRAERIRRLVRDVRRYGDDKPPVPGGSVRILVILAMVLVAGCTRGRAPAGGPMMVKADCDQFAARAIQAVSAQEAATLSAQAAECYARVQVGR